ncbi:MAG: YfiR family protein, partial [Pseudomonadota bacterium]
MPAIYFLLSKALLVLFAICSVTRVIAQTDVLESQVKAAFLYKFPAYVEWSSSSFADAASPLVFGILEADAIADELSLLAGDALLINRKVVIKKLRAGDSIDGLNVLFVGQSQTR